MITEEKLRELYYNPKEGFLPLKRLYAKAKANGIQASLTDVRKFLEKQEVFEITNEANRVFRDLMYLYRRIKTLLNFIEEFAMFS